jgi:hypothetical protein
MKHIFTVSLTIFSLWYTMGQDPLPPKTAYPLDIKQIHSGHSLTDPLFGQPWPGQYVTLMSRLRNTWAGDDIGKSTIPGSPMWWRWENSSGYPDARQNINEFALLSITEVAGLCYEGGSTQGWYLDCIQDQRNWLSTWTNYAWNNGNSGQGAATLLWTNWVNIDGSDGPFRQMLDNLNPEWERMQDFANNNRPLGAPPVYMIPGNRMMARLYDDVQAGLVPGISQFSDFFADNIHVNNLGNFAIAMIHYACIYNASPVGLDHELIDNPAPGTQMPSEALALYIQNMVWDVVTSYAERTGVYQFLNTTITQFEAAPRENLVQLQLKWDFTELPHRIFLEHAAKDQQYRSIYQLSREEIKQKSLLYLHEQPYEGDNYYRLRIQNATGQEQYSPIVQVKFQHVNYRLYPNPVSQTLYLTGNFKRNPSLSIQNLHGQTVLFQESSTQLDLSQLPVGLYFLNIESNGSHWVEKIVIHR